MRKKECEIKDFRIIEKILNEAEVCRIGMSLEGTPYVVPVNFAYADRVVYFHAAREGRKVDCLKGNPRVCIEAEGAFSIVLGERAGECTTHYQSVIAFGKAHFVEDADEKTRALDLLMRKYSGRDGWEYPPGVFDRTLMVRIDLDTISGKQNGAFDGSDSRFNRFQAPREVIYDTLRQLKAHHNVSPQAVFNDAAQDGLRKEISYRDEDFLWFLSRASHEAAITTAAVEYLRGFDLVPAEFVWNEERFSAFRKTVAANFRGSWTSFSPVMERLVYTLTAVRRPRRLVEFGCFWGNTLAWFAGPALGADRLYTADEIVGVDVDGPMIEQARKNFAVFGTTENLRLVNADAREYHASITAPIDFLYLEAKEEGAAEIYSEILQAVYPRLAPGAWIIAHDIYDKDEIETFRPYTDWVRGSDLFRLSLAFDIDSCGLELTIKK